MKSTIVVGPDKTTVTTGHMTTVFRDDTAADQVAMLQQEIQRLIGDVQTLTKSRDHYILDLIYDEQVRGFYPGQRKSECVEFLDLVEMQWYEIVVRPIDGPDR